MAYKHISKFQKQLLCLFLILTLNKPCFAQVFKTNDRIAYTGNSITHNGGYHNFIDLYYILHYPNIRLETFNCGIGGNQTADVLARMQTDILINKPNIATIKLGMNDVGRNLYEKDIYFDQTVLVNRIKQIDAYKKGMEEIISTFIKNNVQVILLTPSIYDQESKIEAENNIGVNDALTICSNYVKELAKKYNYQLVDFNSEMNKINKIGLASDKNFALAGADRIHPLSWGHFVMASIFLKTLEPAKLVSKVDIDFAKKEVLNLENCKITKLKIDQNSVNFTLLENSLPYPVTDEIKTALKYITFNDDFNQQLLKISSLKKGKYQLKIDEIVIDTLSSEVLSIGINTSGYQNTPQFQQAEKVYNLSIKRHNLVSGNLRDIAYLEYGDLTKMKNPGNEQEIKEIFAKKIEDAIGKPWHKYMIDVTNQYFVNKANESETKRKVKALMDEIYQSNQPKEHIYSISIIE